MGAFAKVSFFLMGLAMGTASTIFMKMIYSLQAEGENGVVHRFEKPLATTAIMFLAMSLALPVHLIVEMMKDRKGNKGSKSISVWTYFLLAVPSMFDLLGTALSGAGLLFVQVSVHQLMRCSLIIMTALLKRFVLGSQINRSMWFGIFLISLAMVLVSLSSFEQPQAQETNVTNNNNNIGEVNNIPRDPKIGVILILLSTVVQSTQYIFEEKVMKVDNVPPLLCVALEGIWGLILMIVIVFPLAQYVLPGSDAGGSLENLNDTFIMLGNSRSIQIVLTLFTLTVFFYNVFCLYVTYLLSAIWHAILNNFRPVSVWGVDLLFFYVLTNGSFGEPWTNWSWLELSGMILLFIGTAIYNQTLVLPCTGLCYPTEKSHSLEKSTNPTSSAPLMNSSKQSTYGSATDSV